MQRLNLPTRARSTGIVPPLACDTTGMVSVRNGPWITVEGICRLKLKFRLRLLRYQYQGFRYQDQLRNSSYGRDRVVINRGANRMAFKRAIQLQYLSHPVQAWFNFDSMARRFQDSKALGIVGTSRNAELEATP